jgi:hypothetical protein
MPNTVRLHRVLAMASPDLAMPNAVRLHRVLAMASPDRMTAIGDWLSGRCWPVAGIDAIRLSGR